MRTYLSYLKKICSLVVILVVMLHTVDAAVLSSTENILKNASFEESANSKPIDWKAYNRAKGGYTKGVAHSGSYSIKITDSSGTHSGWYGKQHPIDHKKTITFGGWSKASNISENGLYCLDFHVKFVDGSSTWFYRDLRFNKGTHDWEEVKTSMTFDKEVVSVRPYVLHYNATGTAWFDDIYVYPTETDSSKTVLYEDAEDKKTIGWRVYDKTPAGAIIKNVYDSDKHSRVIAFDGSKTSNGYILGGYYKNNDSWNNKTQKQMNWSIKSKEYYMVFISLDTKKGHRYLYYTPSAKSKGLIYKQYIHTGLGNDIQDGTWHTFNRDLTADLEKYESDNEIIAVEGFLVRGSVKIDDIVLSEGKLDTVKPIITLIGDAKVWLKAGEVYTDPGVHAFDNVDGDITDKVEIVEYSTSVHLRTIGYRVKDKAGNSAYISRKVYYQDVSPPTITLNGDATVYLTVGDMYLESRATYTYDNYHGYATIEGTVDTSKAGTYVLHYSARDQNGNRAEVRRTVIVQEKNSLCPIDTVANRIDNPCFEDSVEWISYVGKDGIQNTKVDTKEYHSGKNALKVFNSKKQNSGWRSNKYIMIKNAKTITFSGWNKAKNISSSALNSLDFRVEFIDGTHIWFTEGIRFKKGTHDWEYVEITKTFDKEVVSILPYALLYYGTGTSWFDDISLQVHDELSEQEIEKRVKKGLGIKYNLNAMPEDLVKNSMKWKETFHVLNRFSYGANQKLLNDVVDKGGIDLWFEDQLMHTTDVSSLVYRDNNNTAQMKLDNYSATYQEMEYIYPVVRPMHSDRQLQAVMGTFWSNHFNTNRVWMHERVKAEDQFFSHALGNFRDLLEISAKSPAMSYYLDGVYNIKGKPNENYAREIMELHTLGVSNYYNCEKKGSYDSSKGYCLSDITALARIFTGWRYIADKESGRYALNYRYGIEYIKALSEDDNRSKSSQAYYIDRYNSCLTHIDKVDKRYCYTDINLWYKKFKFIPTYHDSGSKVFLGKTYSADGQNEGENILDVLAKSPRTAKHICTKLAKKFIADTPTEETISNCQATFLENSESKHQIAEVLRVLKSSIQFKSSKDTKIKDTQEYLLSLARILELDATRYKGDVVRNRTYGLGWSIYRAQQGFYSFGPPTGWSESSEVWGKSDRVMWNWVYDYALIYNKYRGRENLKDYFNSIGIDSARELIFYLLPIMTAGEYEMLDVTHAYEVLCGTKEECELKDNKVKNLIEYLSKNAEFSVQ